MSDKKDLFVEELLNMFKQAKIDYSPLTYYYTPVTPYPRSIMTKTTTFEKGMDLTNFQVMIYIHIPFCSRRCTFCPFFSSVGKEVPQEFLLMIKKQLMQTINLFQLPNKFNIYFGGGSPNLLSINQIKEIIDCFQHKQIEEISIEVHPEVYEKEDYFTELSKLGINRVSIGLQSSEFTILKKSDRGHDSITLKKILLEIKKQNLLANVDVMFGGLYEETLNSAKQTFEYAFGELKPDWVTAYQTCIKTGTPEQARYLENPKKYPNTKTILKMRALRQKIAEKHGYKYLFGDYFSKNQAPKYQTKRWGSRTAVIGIGPGTHSYIIDKEIGLNWYSPFSIKNYSNLIKQNLFPAERLIKLDMKQIKAWQIISTLKTTGSVTVPENNELLEKMTKLNLFHKNKNIYQLTEKGVLIEDLIYAVLMSLQLWKKLSAKKKEKTYSEEDARYDWFFDPDTVIKFREYLSKV